MLNSKLTIFWLVKLVVWLNDVFQADGSEGDVSELFDVEFEKLDSERSQVPNTSG